MIEKNLLNWLDLGEGLEEIDIYKKRKFLSFCKFMKILIASNNFSSWFYLILQSIFFIQIFCISLFDIQIKKSDYIAHIFQYISNIFLIEPIIKNSKSYIIPFVITTILMVILIFCLVIIFILMKLDKANNFLSSLIVIFNFLLQIILNYLIGPIIAICLAATNCLGGTHKFLADTCFGSLHLIIFFFSIIDFIFFFILTIIFSLFYNDIGSIGTAKIKKQVNTKFELYLNLIRIIVFVVNHYFRVYDKNSNIYLIIKNLILALIFIMFIIYFYRELFFYDERMNYLILIGFVLSFWLCFSTAIKIVFNIKKITLFILIGWVILIITCSIIIYYKNNSLILFTNILEEDNIKKIEEFKRAIFNLILEKDIESKTVLQGYFLRFKDYISSFPERKDKFTNISKVTYLKHIYNDDTILNSLFIIYTVYDYYFEKNKINNEIGIYFCYFLINYLKNPALAIYHCAKIKCNSILELYYKYLLAENIKDYLINISDLTSHQDSPRHLQLSTVILYNLYQNLIKLKIYDISDNQIEYFDYFKNFTLSTKNSLGFLQIGKNIIKLRKQIKKLWDKSNMLNPYSNEIKIDYMLYLKLLIQDESLVKKEEKNHLFIKNTFNTHKSHLYFKLFDNSISSVLLVEGNSNNGKILYSTPNFRNIFMLVNKETGNLNVNDLLPKAIEKFHGHLINQTLYYSNLHIMFRKHRETVLKTRNDTIFNVKLYVKELSDLSYGLMYIIHIEKLNNNDFSIILDKDLKINGYTEKANAKKSIDIINTENYGMTPSIIGTHICAVIPEILLLFKHNENGEFVLNNNAIMRNNGNLYPVTSPGKELVKKINDIANELQNGNMANALKSDQKLLCVDDNKQVKNSSSSTNHVQIIQKKIDFSLEKSVLSLNDKYIDLVNEITKNYPKPFKIFFKLNPHIFLGKYKYYNISVTNDVYTLIGEDQMIEQGKINKKINSSIYRSDVVEESDLKSGALGAGVKENIKKIKFAVNLSKIKEKKTKKQNDDLFKEEELEKNNESDKEEKNDENKNKVKDNKTKGVLNSYNSNVDLLKNEQNVIYKITERIMNNKLNTKYNILMTYLSILSGIVSIAFITYDTLIIKKNCEEIAEYLKENSYYNETKITMAQLYMILVNFKFMRYNLVNETDCLDENCSIIYKEELKYAIDSLNSLQREDLEFHSDFGKKLDESSTAERINFYTNETKGISVTHNQLIRLMISNSLQFYDNLDLVIKNSTHNMFVTIMNNLLNYANLFVKEEFGGFSNNILKKNIAKNFKLIPYPLILMCVCTFVLVLLFSYFVFIMNNIEIFFIDKIINLNSASFEEYLKTLNDLKKKFKNDNNEEEDKLENEEDENDDSKDINNKNLDKISENKEQISKIAGGEKQSIREKKRKEKFNKKDRDKKIKLLEQKRYKIRKMENLFIINNFLNAIKILLPIILGITYYIFQTLIKNSRQSKYITFNENIESINYVYDKSFSLYLDINYEIVNFTNLYVIKEIAKYNLTNQITKYEIIKGINYTNADEIDKIPNYVLKIFEKNEYNFPRFGNLIMEIINNIKNTDTSNTTEAILYKLFSGDACLVLFENNKDEKYISCSNYWSGVVSKGLQQVIIDMGSKFSSLLDKLAVINTNNQSNNIIDFLASDDYKYYDHFVLYYFFRAFIKSLSLFDVLRDERIKKAKNIFDIVFYCYIVLDCIFLLILVYYVHATNKLFNDFLGFISIIPSKIITEDGDIYLEISRIEKNVLS